MNSSGVFAHIMRKTCCFRNDLLAIETIDAPFDGVVGSAPFDRASKQSSHESDKRRAGGDIKSQVNGGAGFKLCRPKNLCCIFGGCEASWPDRLHFDRLFKSDQTVFDLTEGTNTFESYWFFLTPCPGDQLMLAVDL